jgi:hypothetical protein
MISGSYGCVYENDSLLGQSCRRILTSERYNCVRFQVLTAVSMMFRVVFWDILPCKMIVDLRFRGAYCLHHPWWSQKTTLNIRCNCLYHQVNCPDYTRSTHLWNVGLLLWDYTALYPRRLPSSSHSLLTKTSPYLSIVYFITLYGFLSNLILCNCLTHSCLKM